VASSWDVKAADVVVVVVPEVGVVWVIVVTLTTVRVNDHVPVFPSESVIVPEAEYVPAASVPVVETAPVDETVTPVPVVSV
jgi:hypothetical protein